METNNLTQICFFFTIALICFTGCVNFVSLLGIFGPTTPEVGVDVGVNSSTDAFANFTKSPTATGGLDMTSLWRMVLGAAVIGGVAIAWLLQDATILGIYIFSVVFWASYINAWTIMGGLTFIPIAFLGLFTVPILFIFVGAVIGMLSGV